jgi:hypothetical protein
MAETLQDELAAMAEDELARACTLTWLALSKVTPWGDTYEGFAPSGRPVQVERNYVWASQPGGDVLVEVVVFQNAVLYDQGARVSRVIGKI